MTGSRPSTHPSSVRGYLFLFVAVLFWGGSASLAKFLFTKEYDTLIITQTRSSLSFLLFLLYFLLRNRAVFQIEARDIPRFALVGVIGIAATNFSYYYTVQHATVATAILIQYTAPVLVMAYAVFVSKEESFNGIKAVSLLLSLLGCYLAVSGADLTAVRLQGWALVSGIASSFCYSFMLLASKSLLKKYSVWTMMIYVFGFAALFWLFVNPPWSIGARHYAWADWGVFWVFAVVSILIPHSAFTSGLKVLEASTVGIVTTLEPVIAILVAYLTLGETLNGVQLVGGAAVIGAILLLQLRPQVLPGAGEKNHAR